jgi:hypothetical protein
MIGATAVTVTGTIEHSIFSVTGESSALLLRPMRNHFGEFTVLCRDLEFKLTYRLCVILCYNRI